MLKKKSFSLSGHRTSVALEEEFWSVLGQSASGQGIALAALVAKIDSGRCRTAIGQCFAPLRPRCQ